jgi:hypothetical protein
MSVLYDSQLAGLTETIAADGGTFQWSGKTYNGIVDHVAHNITTLKSYFASAEPGVSPAYPKCGDPITVAGRKFQITKKGNAGIKAVSGGFIEEPPFVDDPTDPALDLTFDSWIKK